MKQPLSLRKVGAVARLRMERPEVHNAFDAALVVALTHALSGLALDASVRVLVLEGEGASFSAGADLHWMRGMAAASELDNRQDGPRHARRYFASAEIFDAAQAQRMGLLHEVVEADALDDTVQRQVDLLLKAGPIAAASAKALVRNVASASGPVAIDTANAELIARLRVSPEGQEGINAFLEKRKPKWVRE